MSEEASETESEFDGMSCEREVQMRRRIPKLARLQKDVFECSIAYLIASLFTFVPCCLRMCPLCVMATADRAEVICSLHLSYAGTRPRLRHPTPSPPKPSRYNDRSNIYVLFGPHSFASAASACLGPSSINAPPLLPLVFFTPRFSAHEFMRLADDIQQSLYQFDSTSNHAVV
ncbi:hypothetical protein M422DRAFT_240513 [Sphaerobolus stellatus SS14]|nr:hypothetical protein M422DRAFT_240513 [Sphaerobolus stellatus SS14]